MPVALIFHKTLKLLYAILYLTMIQAEHIDQKHEGTIINYVPYRDYNRNIMIFPKKMYYMVLSLIFPRCSNYYAASNDNCL